MTGCCCCCFEQTKAKGQKKRTAVRVMIAVTAPENPKVPRPGRAKGSAAAAALGGGHAPSRLLDPPIAPLCDDAATTTRWSLAAFAQRAHTHKHSATTMIAIGELARYDQQQLRKIFFFLSFLFFEAFLLE